MFKSKKPYTAITAQIENLTNEGYEEDDLSGIPELVDTIKLQDSGPTEASRAIRKKLKYGNAHRQIRALVLLDGLIQNAGTRFQRTFADEALLERLRLCATSDSSDPTVKAKCKELYRSWANEYKGVAGLEQIVTLFEDMPRRKGYSKSSSKALKESENPFGPEEFIEEEFAGGSAQGYGPRKFSIASPLAELPMSSSIDIEPPPMPKPKKEKKLRPPQQGQMKPFNFDKEKEEMKACIAESSVVSINLLNSLRLINREQKQISADHTAVQHFEYCKIQRRKILRYIQNVDSDEWIGPLLHANDELVNALMTFEQLDRSIDADSDSDDEMAEQQHMYNTLAANAQQQGRRPSRTHKALSSAFSNFSISRHGPDGRRVSDAGTSGYAPVSQGSASGSGSGPHIRVQAPALDEEDEDDETDPFNDHNAISTPRFEGRAPNWGKK